MLVVDFMEHFQTFIILMSAAAILIGIAQKIHIPYPIALVLGGASIGFLPYQKDMLFDPHLLLLIVFPPILYYAAYSISFREFKKNLPHILSLALGLVLFTTFIIGLIFKWLFPELPLALAFAFGAIISPPDATAATSILKRFAIGNRLLTILEGESLVNDSTALVLYKIAVVALLTGTFSFSEGAIEFVKTVSGGMVVGVILGILFQFFSRRFLGPVTGVIFSFSIPYITYFSADYLQVSGVLAVVVNGLMGSQMLIRHHSSLRRILGYAFWDIFIILMNCFVFVLLGLQLKTLTSAMSIHQIAIYGGHAVLITAALIVVRMVWIYARNGIMYVKAIKKPKAKIHCSQILRESAIVGWSGMRGIVSLTAALALPLVIPGRNDVILITFFVILLTLLIPGLTLSYLIRKLNVHQHPEIQSLLEVKRQLSSVAKDKLDEMYQEKQVTEDEYEFFKGYLDYQLKLSIDFEKKKAQNLESVRDKIVHLQRKKLLELWERYEIDDELMNHLSQELDLEVIHLARSDLH